MKISLNKKKLTDIAFIVPSLAGVSIFVLIPFIDVLRRSFTNQKPHREMLPARLMLPPRSLIGRLQLAHHVGRVI